MLFHPPYSSKPAPWNFLPLSTERGLAEKLVTSRLVSGTFEDCLAGGCSRWHTKVFQKTMNGLRGE
jgi:hypothetical protein